MIKSLIIFILILCNLLLAQTGLDELQMRDTDQLQVYKDRIPDSTYKWYWGSGATDDESIKMAIRKAEEDNTPEGQVVVFNFIIYYITYVNIEGGKYVYYNKVGLKKQSQ